MATLTDFIVNWGEVIELDFPKWDLSKMMNVLNKHSGWKEYQPHKPGYNRYGLSVTSLDGGFSGKPDLCSLREYQTMYGESYNEMSFTKRTNIVQFLPELNEFLDFWEPNLGRTHFLRLDRGGFLRIVITAH